MTLIESAKKNKLTPLILTVAGNEGIKPALLLRRIKEGKAVVPRNANHSLKKPCAIGLGLSTKINANIGTSTDKCSVRNEIKKLAVAVSAGADTVMDLSVGGDLKKIRREVLKYSPVPVGTVPVYEIAVNARRRKKSFLRFGCDDILETLEEQAEDGVDFFTIHAGVTEKSLGALKEQKRLLSIVSRGGAILAAWMNHHRRENPFYACFDRILDIAYRYDVTLSLGDGLRPGSIHDATDRAQIAELKILAELTRRARVRNVQVMIEGPGHVPLDEIKKNVYLEKSLCNGAPFYVLGPLVTDVASGHDHISAAIGGALAASYGADLLCYVTPSEHLRHPDAGDVHEGVVASRIAAHAADIVKYKDTADRWDKEMSLARRQRDWKKQIRLSVDPQKAKKYRLSSRPDMKDVCSMCGEYCSIKLMQECMRV
ncbi:MAG: phosphomethylpyrimidine synthase ThiC [Candidatus Omnitrophica bacterium]|nr:phosphomethylpyrimidine synthase ThiC [Candidatus Omnitrophota bacterium]